MVDPVLAEDGETYELSAILEWLEDFDTSPLQPSIYIDAETLRFNKVVYEMIADLVASNTLDEETMAKWHARKDEPERLFEVGCYLEAATLGHPAAMGRIARHYYEGAGSVGVEKDYAKAFEFATKAAKEGVGEGMVVLGDCYRWGRGGVAEDDVAALKWYEESAEKGNSDGMNRSGQCYLAGIGCVKDDSKALAYFSSAGCLGHSYATNELAVCYCEGAGVEQNLETARELFSIRNPNPNADSNLNLGLMMIRGTGGAKEIGKGVSLVEKAAKAGNELAIARIAEIEELCEQLFCGQGYRRERWN